MPELYIEFLKCISGGDDVGISFLVDGTEHEICIWNAEKIADTLAYFLVKGVLFES